MSSHKEETHWDVQTYGGKGSFGRERMPRALEKACLTLASIQKKMMVEQRGGRNHHSEGQGRKPVLNLTADHRDCTREEFWGGTTHYVRVTLLSWRWLDPYPGPWLTSLRWSHLLIMWSILYTFRSWSWLMIICVVHLDIFFTFCP